MRIFSYLFFCSVQIAAFGTVVWFANTPEGRANGGSNSYAVTMGGIFMAMLATSACMIIRDSILFIVRRLRAAVSKPYYPDYRSHLAPPRIAAGKPSELLTSVRIGKQIS